MEKFRIQNNSIELLDREREREKKGERKNSALSVLNNFFSQSWLRYLSVVSLTCKAAAHHLD